MYSCLHRSKRLISLNADCDWCFLLKQDLQKDGYDVGELPENEGDIMQAVLNDPEAKYNSADLNVAYKMSVDEYKKLCPYAEALEENWGKPPGDCSSFDLSYKHAPIE